MTKKIVIIGTGRWGKFLDEYFRGIGWQVTTLGREGSECGWPSVDFGDIDYIFVAVGTQNCEAVAQSLSEADVDDRIPIISCNKGMNAEFGCFPTEVFEEYLDNTMVFLGGPCQPDDVRDGKPAELAYWSRDQDLAGELSVASNSKSGLITFYCGGTDIIGAQVGATLKNVYGILAGLLIGYGDSPLINLLPELGPVEAGKLLRAMRDDKHTEVETANGLAHEGDYQTTLFSQLSRNRRYGIEFAKNGESDIVAEGAESVRPILDLAQEYGVDMPLVRAVHSVLFGQLPGRFVDDPKRFLIITVLGERKSDSKF